MTDLTVGAELLECRPRHRAQESRTFLNEIACSVPFALEGHLVLDNLRAHKAGLIRDRPAKRPRYHVHFTPTPHRDDQRRPAPLRQGQERGPWSAAWLKPRQRSTLLPERTADISPR